MRLRNRFLLIALGIVLFTIATPVIVLYARGFKYDFKTGQITKTGALVVRTIPTKADIFLNNEKQDSVSPANVRFLIPGDYEIRLEKEGYQTWRKRLPIRAQFVTWTNHNREYVTLFLNNPKFEQTFTNTEDYFPTETQALVTPATANLIAEKIPDAKQTKIVNAGNKIFALVDETLYVINDSLERIYSPVTYTSWDEESQQMLFANNNEIQIYNPVTKNSELILRTIAPLSNALINVQNGYVFYVSEEKIKAVELDGRDQRNIYTILENLGQQAKFQISRDGNSLYLWNSEGGKIFTII